MPARSPNCKLLSAATIAALLAFAPALAEARTDAAPPIGARHSQGRHPRKATPPKEHRTIDPAPEAPRPSAPLPPPSPVQKVVPPAAPEAPAIAPPIADTAVAAGRPSASGLAGGLARGVLGAIVAGLFAAALVVLFARRGLSRAGQPRLAGRSAAPHGFAFSGASLGATAPRGPHSAPIDLRREDFQAFERALLDAQSAYSQEDVGRLDELATPEMMSHFSDDIRANAREGVVNRISEVKLLQGDLGDAWREGDDEFAAVALRFSLIDLFIDRASGKVVSGDPTRPTQSKELWTFHRPAGRGSDAWRLASIQQAA